jgi:hypothetical protein
MVSYSSRFTSTDLWRYDVKLGQWYNVGGYGRNDDFGSYVEKGNYSMTSWPSARANAQMMIDIATDEIYIFSGEGFEKDNEYSLIPLDDLWSFKVASLQWRYLLGNSPGSSQFTDTPIGRPGYLGVAAEGKNAIYIYGGYTKTRENILDEFLSLDLKSRVWKRIDDREMLTPYRIAMAPMTYSTSSYNIYVYGGASLVGNFF